MWGVMSYRSPLKPAPAKAGAGMTRGGGCGDDDPGMGVVGGRRRSDYAAITTTATASLPDLSNGDQFLVPVHTQSQAPLHEHQVHGAHQPCHPQYPE